MASPRATWERYVVLSHVILSLPVRERRGLFTIARDLEGKAGSGDVFFPEHGFSLGEFALFHVLGESKGSTEWKRKKKKAKKDHLLLLSS